MYTNTLTLANGVEIPQLGLGTWLVVMEMWQTQLRRL